MDLNVENYTYNDILVILNISKNNVNELILNKAITSKIKEITFIDKEELPEPLDKLIDFFFKCYDKALGELKYNKLNDNINKFNERLFEEKNDIIRESNNFVINNTIPEKNTINSFNVPIKKGLINPLTIKTLHQVININTKFRDNYNTTISTDFNLQFSTPIKKVINMKLLNYGIPSTVYSVSSKLGSNTFVINDTEIVLDNGSYNDPRVMVKEINAKIKEADLNVELCYNGTSGTMTFSSLDNTEFTLDFNTNNTIDIPNNLNRDHLTLGWMLGFRGGYLNKTVSMPINRYYKSKKSDCCNLVEKNNDLLDNFYYGDCCYSGESIFDNFGNNYFLLSINDYQNNHNSIFTSPFKYQSSNDNNILAKINLENKVIDYPKRIYFGPTDIGKLSIKLYDEYGRIIDNNNADYSLELLCEVIYDY